MRWAAFDSVEEGQARARDEPMRDFDPISRKAAFVILSARRPRAGRCAPRALLQRTAAAAGRRQHRCRHHDVEGVEPTCRDQAAQPARRPDRQHTSQRQPGAHHHCTRPSDARRRCMGSAPTAMRSASCCAGTRHHARRYQESDCADTTASSAKPLKAAVNRRRSEIQAMRRRYHARSYRRREDRRRVAQLFRRTAAITRRPLVRFEQRGCWRERVLQVRQHTVGRNTSSSVRCLTSPTTLMTSTVCASTPSDSLADWRLSAKSRWRATSITTRGGARRCPVDRTSGRPRLESHDVEVASTHSSHDGFRPASVGRTSRDAGRGPRSKESRRRSRSHAVRGVLSARSGSVEKEVTRPRLL